MSLTIKRLRVVLMTYLMRRAFHGTLLTIAAGVGIGKLMSLVHYSPGDVGGVLIEAFLTIMVSGSAFVAILLFFLQAREQLMGLGARLRPESRTAHLIVIGTLFLGISVAISSIEWERPQLLVDSAGHTEWRPGVSPVGQTVIVLAYMTMAAFVVYNPWLLPIFGTMLILAVRQSPVEYLIEQATIIWPPEKTGSPHSLVQRLVHLNGMYLRAVVFLTNLIALQVLVRLARPKPERAGLLISAVHRLTQSISNLQPTRVFSAMPHVPVTSMLSRGRHRRHAVHSHKAPWVLAVELAVVLVGLLWLVGIRAPANSRVLAALVMLTLVPGVVVAAGWRERWAGLGYESLFPSRREQFVNEIAIGLAADLAEFWLAALISSMVALALFAPESLRSLPFVVSIIASLMMQVLWIGTIFLISRFRQIVPYAVLLICVGLAMLVPLFEFWADRRIFGPSILLTIALAEMTCGIIFLLSGLGLWRRADLA